MNKQLTLIVALLTLITSLGFAQEEESVLSAPENWRSELIPFPLPFAPSIDFKGIEDIRFAPGWSDAESRDFWTYAFVWYIDKEAPMTTSGLSIMLDSYYDGLMNVVAKEEEKAAGIPKTLSLFIKADEGLKGKVRVYDAFFTKDLITLHLTVEERFCPASNKQIVLFKLSPHGFDDEIWKELHKIELSVKCD